MIENWNEVYEEKGTKENNILLSRDPAASLPSSIMETSDDDEGRIMVPWKSPYEHKHNFQHPERKFSVSLNIFHEENTKILDNALVDTKLQPCYDSEPSAVFPEKCLMMNIST